MPPQMREPVIDAMLQVCARAPLAQPPSLLFRIVPTGAALCVQPAVLNMSASVQSIYMQCVLKLLSVMAASEAEGEDDGAPPASVVLCRCV